MQRNPTALNGAFDLLIIGGGITGAGVALDAVTRGLRVALIDKSDFAAGTSSASSKLVHGGLRYLEQGQFRLVYEALHERRRLLANAPHLVRPLPFTLPYSREGSLPMWKGQLGLWLYDRLAGANNLPPSRRLSRSELRRLHPQLRGEDLVGGSRYYDAQMDDARLVIAVLQTACADGAVAVNYAEVVGFVRGAVQVRDRLDDVVYEVRARQVLNAAGPWVDAVERLAGGTDEPRLQPTKGVHLVVPDVGLTAALLLTHPADGRVFFVIPWQGRTLIGTTDTFATDGPDTLTVTADEVAYLLAGYNAHLAPALAPADVCGSFAGLRPLLRARTGAASSRSREYAIWPGPGNMLCVGGGKYTTYRHMAEVITDTLCGRLGTNPRCRTARRALVGTPREPWTRYVATSLPQLVSRGLTSVQARHLLDRYGTEAFAVLPYLDDRGRELIVDGEPDMRGEWEYQRQHEMAIEPADHWLRRSRLGLFGPIES